MGQPGHSGGQPGSSMGQLGTHPHSTPTNPGQTGYAPGPPRGDRSSGQGAADWSAWLPTVIRQSVSDQPPASRQRILPASRQEAAFCHRGRMLRDTSACRLTFPTRLTAEALDDTESSGVEPTGMRHHSIVGLRAKHDSPSGRSVRQNPCVDEPWKAA
jgi:hypothetical protein